MAHRNPLTLSRQDLYELVWSKPVTEVAKEIGLSDVAVAKRCRQVQVPVPPRGYWARVSAGQTPRRTPLPKYRDSSASVARSRSASIPEIVGLAEFGQSPARDRPRRKKLSDIVEPTVTFYRDNDPKQGARSDEQDALGPHSHRYAALDAKLSTLPAPADAPESWVAQGDTAVPPEGWPEKLRTEGRLPPIAVHTKASMLRARRITTHLIEVVTQLGWRFVPETPDPQNHPHYRRAYETSAEVARRSAHFLVEDERLFISLTERQIRKERSLTTEEQREQRRNPNAFWFRERYSYHPSSELTLHISTSPGRGGGSAAFRDSKRMPLEVKISSILRCLLKESLDIKDRRREAAEAAERQRQEEQRRERIRKSREAHAHLIAGLEAESGAWERAQRLRRYVRAARRALSPGARIEAKLEGEPIDLLALGETFANQLDPLHPAQRGGPLFDGKDPYATGFTYESDDAKLRNFVARVLGGKWRHAPKRLAAEPDASGRSETEHSGQSASTLASDGEV